VNQDFNWYALVPWQKTPNVFEHLLKHHKYTGEKIRALESPNLTFSRTN
jgi:hypothetical protein